MASRQALSPVNRDNELVVSNRTIVDRTPAVPPYPARPILPYQTLCLRHSGLTTAVLEHGFAINYDNLQSMARGGVGGLAWLDALSTTAADISSDHDTWRKSSWELKRIFPTEIGIMTDMGS